MDEKMVAFFVKRIRQGKMSLSDVPYKWYEKVQKALS
jgi:hypothetical protein